MHLGVTDVAEGGAGKSLERKASFTDLGLGLNETHTKLSHSIWNIISERFALVILSLERMGVLGFMPFLQKVW